MCIFCGRKEEPIYVVENGKPRIIGYAESPSTICSECLKDPNKVDIFHLITNLKILYGVDASVEEVSRIYYELKKEGIKNLCATDIYKKLKEKK